MSRQAPRLSSLPPTGFCWTESAACPRSWSPPGWCPCCSTSWCSQSQWLFGVFFLTCSAPKKVRCFSNCYWQWRSWDYWPTWRQSETVQLKCGGP